MNAYWAESIATGIFICLYLQLLLLGLFNLWHKSAKNKILGLFCCFMALPFIYNLYWPIFNNNLFFNLLFGSYKLLFLPALLFLYLCTLRDKSITARVVLIHMLLPVIVQFSYVVIKFGFTGFYSENIVIIVATVHFFILLSYFGYLILGIPILKKLKGKLLRKGYLRYSLFFWVVSIYQIRLNIASLLEILMPQSDFRASFGFLFQDNHQILAVLVTTGILVFAFIESPSLKSALLGNRIYHRYDTISDEETIRQFITDCFESEKVFTRAEFDLKTLLRTEKIAISQFKLFLRKEFDQTPLEFINTFRIKEFKSLLLLEENRKYSLMGIAEKVGFSSKATFYRQFKQHEGITPKQYLEQMKAMQS